MKRMLVLFWMVLLVTAPLAAQNLRISGRVLDAETGLPVVRARILHQDQPCFTDSAGQFSFLTQVSSPVLSVSSLGYAAQVFRVHRQGTEEIVIRLQPEGVEVAGAVITDSPIERFWPEQRDNVFDYEFYGDRLLLLMRRPGETVSRLVLTDLNGNVLGEHKGYREPPYALQRDCMGFVHLISDHYASQVFVGGNDIFLEPASRADFDDIVVPCMGVLEGTWFFGKQNKEQLMNYWYITEGSTELHPMCEITDQYATFHQQDQMTDYSSAVTSREIGATSSPESRAAEYRYWHEIHFPPLYAPLLMYQGQALLFDHAHDEIIWYDAAGAITRRTAIGYHEDDRWSRVVFANAEETRIFTLYEKGGFCTLYEIAPESGELVRSWDLEKQFISEVQVYDGAVWFLYREPGSSAEMQGMYHMEL